MLIYFNKETKQTEIDVRIHNFSKNMPGKIRIIGSMNLNPSDKNYPDKKWVNISDIFETVTFSEYTIKNYTI